MRDAVIIAVAVIFAIALGAWLFLLESPAYAPGPVTPGTASYTVLAEGQDSGAFAERKNFRIQTREDFLELWNMLYGEEGPTIPTVDFEKYEVLAIFDGTHSSGGYDVNVTNVNDTANSRVIEIARVMPGETCITTAALTSPFEIVMVGKTVASISRTEKTVTVECE